MQEVRSSGDHRYPPPRPPSSRPRCPCPGLGVDAQGVSSPDPRRPFRGDRICRIAGLAYTHIHALLGIFHRDLIAAVIDCVISLLGDPPCRFRMRSVAGRCLRDNVQIVRFWTPRGARGHVLSGHAVYRTMLFHLINLAQRIAWMPIGSLGLRAIIWGLEEWYRKSELSCDRGGLLAAQDVDAARRALMKMAGGSRLSEMSPDAFHDQAHEYDAVPDVRDSLLKLLQLQGVTPPFAVVRFAELDRWATSGDYARILAGDYPRREDDPTASVGEEVRSAARSYQESWSRSEDPLVGLVKGFADTAAGAGERIFSGLFGGGRRNGDDDDQS